MQTIPEPWEYKGVSYKGDREIPVWVFKNASTRQRKGFSVWQVQPPTKQQAIIVLNKWLNGETINF